MIYNCNITKNTDNFYEVCFPDMSHIITIGFSHEHALEMAKEALDGVLMTSLDNNLTIEEPTYKGGYPIEVSVKIAFAYNLRK